MSRQDTITHDQADGPVADHPAPAPAPPPVLVANEAEPQNADGDDDAPPPVRSKRRPVEE